MLYSTGTQKIALARNGVDSWPKGAKEKYWSGDIVGQKLGRKYWGRKGMDQASGE